ncbi:MAG: hypothetical protein HY735_03010 [Verrucomicrobia bacterium]|nr:hypothetical protein [Verrucomicrobiota bacterium]
MGKIVLTGIGRTERIHQAYQLGAHSFLIKPLRIEDFANLLNALRGLRFVSEGQGSFLEFGEMLAK